MKLQCSSETVWTTGLRRACRFWDAVPSTARCSTFYERVTIPHDFGGHLLHEIVIIPVDVCYISHQV